MTNPHSRRQGSVPGVRSDERSAWGSARRRAHDALQVRNMRNKCCMLHERMHFRNGVAHGAHNNARDGACTAHDAQARERCATRFRCCAHMHHVARCMLRNNRVRSACQNVQNRHVRPQCVCAARRGVCRMRAMHNATRHAHAAGPIGCAARRSWRRRVVRLFIEHLLVTDASLPIERTRKNVYK